ncbi:SOS response-associated peptidase [Plantactinospora sp. KBS50]|uniref:SOS response-associated peptidase n=1 Tax=Plantactinospora sp. KBS50 TaxID=2024580 RepID=UPI001E5CAF95|nr:SOS response-associated peptidase [Plantactinospora sp. KBS50]
MCGRYATTRGAAELGALFDAGDDTGGLAPDYNVAPTDPVPVVRLSSTGQRRLATARWGLVPHWAPDPTGAARMINARAETVATSRAFARSFARRRCLIPADGWYEWVRRDGGRQPYFMTPRDGSVLAFAGIWSPWSAGRGAARADPGAVDAAGPHRGSSTLLTCAIITRPAIGELARVHDRMPLILPAQRWSAWLAGGGHAVGDPDPDPDRDLDRDPAGGRAVRGSAPGPAASRPAARPMSTESAISPKSTDAAGLLAPPPAALVAGLEIRPVGRAVGDVRNDGPGLITPLPDPETGPEEPVRLTLF